MDRSTQTSEAVSNQPAVVLVGNPNVGKSVIFAYLTGRYATVSNFPGTTVEVFQGRAHGDTGTLVIDTPGANSLHPQSVDERVTRDILLSTDLKFVLQVADAKNLRRGLTITTQLAEMGLPVVLVMNMMDEANRRGIRISSEALSETIGIPIVETVAIEKRGFRKLAQQLSGTPGVPNVEVIYPPEIEKGIKEITGLLPEMPLKKRAIALMFLSDPQEAIEAFEKTIGRGCALEIKEIVETIENYFSNPLSYIIGVSRSRTVDRLLDTVFIKDPSILGEKMKTKMKRHQVLLTGGLAVFSLFLYLFVGTGTLAEWGLHPTLLHLIALMVGLQMLPQRLIEKITTHNIVGVFFLFEILYLMYKFVGVFGAGVLVDTIETKVFHELLIPFVVSGVERVLPIEFFKDMFVGDYGLISMGLSYAIGIVMPIVATFFLAFGILEDSGYLPRLSVVADKGMKAMGLNGKAVLPMVLGLGCGTMATLTTRILDSPKDRIIATLLLALGIPCSAQLGVILAIVAQCSAAVTATVFIVVLAQLFLVGSLSAKIIKGRSSDFVIELPPLRMPQLTNIILKTYHRMKWFLIEAVPLFLAGTFILFIIDRVGGITILERMARPVIEKMLGLPIESTVAFIIGFFRRDYGAAGLFDLFREGLLTNNQVAVSMVVITLFVPCVASFLVIIKERGIRVAMAMVAFILPYAILVGAILNGVLNLANIRL